MRSFEKNLVEHCAPTLAGLKSANLFRVKTTDVASLQKEIAVWQPILAERGLTLTVLKECLLTNACLVYLYRKPMLERELNLPATKAFLKSEGYPVAENCQEYLQELSHRLCLQQEFPHEIGVFLGYPLCDVVGFITQGGKNFTYRGYWKAYGDPDEAHSTFTRLHHCTRTYLRCFDSGFPIHRLAVAV